MTIKQISRAVAGLIASVAASAAMAADVTAFLNTALLTANNLTVSPLGTSSYNDVSGKFVSPIDAGNTTAMLTDLGNADGFSVATAYGPLNFTNFSFQNATGILFGNIVGGGFLNDVNFTGDLLKADTLTTVGADLVATDFTLSSGLSAYLTGLGISATALPVGQLISSFTVPGAGAPVPEPSTYALMGLGLVGISLVARKRQAV